MEVLDLPQCDVPREDHAWHLFPVVLNERARIGRNAFIEALAEQGIGTSVHYKLLHRMTYYRDRYGLRPEDFPVSERIWRGCVTLPLYPGMTEAELGRVVEVVRGVVVR